MTTKELINIRFNKGWDGESPLPKRFYTFFSRYFVHNGGITLIILNSDFFVIVRTKF